MTGFGEIFYMNLYIFHEKTNLREESSVFIKEVRFGRLIKVGFRVACFPRNRITNNR